MYTYLSVTPTLLNWCILSSGHKLNEFLFSSTKCAETLIRAKFQDYMHKTVGKEYGFDRGELHDYGEA